jgi:hypothetical protein
MKSFVTDGYVRAVLAMTCSLGFKGCQIFVGAACKICLASFLRYCHLGFYFPNPVEQPKAFANFLIDMVEQYHIQVLMPGNWRMIWVWRFLAFYSPWYQLKARGTPRNTKSGLKADGSREIWI